MVDHVSLRLMKDSATYSDQLKNRPFPTRQWVQSTGLEESDPWDSAD